MPFPADPRGRGADAPQVPRPRRADTAPREVLVEVLLDPAWWPEVRSALAVLAWAYPDDGTGLPRLPRLATGPRVAGQGVVLPGDTAAGPRLRGVLPYAARQVVGDSVRDVPGPLDGTSAELFAVLAARPETHAGDFAHDQQITWATVAAHLGCPLVVTELDAGRVTLHLVSRTGRTRRARLAVEPDPAVFDLVAAEYPALRPALLSGHLESADLGPLSPEPQLEPEDADRCPVAIHHAFDPDAPVVLAAPAADPDQERRDLQSAAFVERVAVPAVVVGAAEGGHEVLRVDPDLAHGEAAEVTLAALEHGVDLVMQGTLPGAGRRAGLRVTLARIGTGYVPLELIHEPTLVRSRGATAQVASLRDPALAVRQPGYRTADVDPTALLRLAHATRLLQELDLHAGGRAGSTALLRGGLVGTSNLTEVLGETLGVVWIDLASDGPDGRRSPLARYDQEFAFRVAAADAARWGGRVVRPLHVAECAACPWQSHCRRLAGPTDSSFAVRSDLLTASDWLALSRHGYDDVARLAAADPADLVGLVRDRPVAGYGTLARMATVVSRARLVRDGVGLLPATATATTTAMATGLHPTG